MLGGMSPDSPRLSSDTTSRPSDLIRQIVVISALCFALISAWIGVGGGGGTPVEDAQDGALSTTGSFLAPAGPAFSIWSVIYLGLLGYTVWQALPRQRTNPRQRSLGWWIALTLVLNGLWLVASQFGPILSTVLVIFALLAALGFTFRRAVVTRTPDDGVIDSVLIDGVTGLHLGWVTAASVANVAGWLTPVGPNSWGAQPTLWGVAVLVVVLLIGLGTAWASGWRVTPALALGWGLVWIAVGRLTGPLREETIGWTALVVAVVIVVPTLLIAGVRALRPQGD